MTNNIDLLDVFARGAKAYRSTHGMNDTAGMIVSPASLGAGAEAVAKAVREEIVARTPSDYAGIIEDAESFIRMDEMPVGASITMGRLVKALEEATQAAKVSAGLYRSSESDLAAALLELEVRRGVTR